MYLSIIACDPVDSFSFDAHFALFEDASNENPTKKNEQDHRKFNDGKK